MKSWVARWKLPSRASTQLQAIGAWKNPKTGRRVPVSKSTLHRVTDPAEKSRDWSWAVKRIRGANRNGGCDPGTPPTGRSQFYQEEGGETERCAPCWNRSPSGGACNALFTTRLLVEAHGADY